MKVNFGEEAAELLSKIEDWGFCQLLFGLTLYFLTEGKEMLVDSTREIFANFALRIYCTTKKREIELAAELDWGFEGARLLAELNAFTEKAVYGDITLLPDAAPQATPDILPNPVKGLIEAEYVEKDGKPYSKSAITHAVNYANIGK